MHQWDDGTMAYFSLHEWSEHHPSCGLLIYKVIIDVEVVSCIDREHYFLCEKDETSQQTQASYRDTSANRADRLVRASNSSLPFTPVACPTGHWTHELLACDSLSYCWQWDQAGQSSGRGTRTSKSPCQEPLSTLFRCRNAVESVPYSLVCDHSQDCLDFSDEDFCVHPSCSGSWQFECTNKQVRPCSITAQNTETCKTCENKSSMIKSCQCPLVACFHCIHFDCLQVDCFSFIMFSSIFFRLSTTTANP